MVFVWSFNAWSINSSEYHSKSKLFASKKCNLRKCSTISNERKPGVLRIFFFWFLQKKICYNSFFQTWCIWLGMLYPKFLFTFSVILLIYSIWKWCMMLSSILYAFLKSRLVLNMLRKKNHCSYFFLPPALFPHYKYSYIPSSTQGTTDKVFFISADPIN